MLHLLDTGIQSASENMRLDAKLLEELEETPILHLYDWMGPSLTYGHFIDPKEHLCSQVLQDNGIAIARRPTGGGIVFHIWDYAFSFLMPSSHPLFSLNTLENYRFVNQVVMDVAQEMFSIEKAATLLPESVPLEEKACGNFCMARPTQYDVVYKGFKIAGAAQRKTKKGYLHQGTISLAFPDIPLLKMVLLQAQDVMAAMSHYSFAHCKMGELGDVRKKLGQKLALRFREVC